MDNLREFCQARKMNKHLEDAFITYVRSSYSSAYAVKPGETLSKMLEKMTPEKVMDMWLLFVLDFKETLVSE